MTCRKETCPFFTNYKYDTSFYNHETPHRSSFDNFATKLINSKDEEDLLGIYLKK
ncbi:hypothetical protein HMPREF0663_12041 [Hoylesella oralis ATCC 33269]|uniref:Uncharacterized protein n=1 Tax=Hoylesella oralis ATCC 33269 TaxID=873533 RepID=E7RTG8_9BACT|nr:hypothetical protein HMPREF0663_12041 [Hoylesella oralis ATCC 33269]